MFKHQDKTPGFTLFELVVVLGIVTFLAGTVFVGMGPMVRRNEVLNNLRYVRAAVMRGRAKAIEYTNPVQLMIFDDNSVLLVRDPTRDGDWADGILLLGESTSEGESSPYTKVVRTNQTDIANPLPHWTKIVSLGDVAEFTNESIILPDGSEVMGERIIILPDGRVMAGDPLAASSGTWYFKDDHDRYYGAVHVTAMGEIKMAFINKDVADATPGGEYNGWTWTD